MQRHLTTSLAATGVSVLLVAAASAADLGPQAVAVMPPPVRPFDFSGPYAGASLGLGFLNADSSTVSNNTSIDSNLPSPPGLVTTHTSNQFMSGKARSETGALADASAGYNFRLAPAWLTGVQLEGSLGRLFARFNESGVSNFNSVRSDLGLTNFSDSTFTQKDSLNITFMVSALAKFGYLVTPRDLIYALAGWSYAGFNTTLPTSIDPVFGANGVTAGVGWERQILDGWTLKLEYRYTQFETVTVPSLSASFQTSFNPAGVAVESSGSTLNAASRVSPSLQVVRVGFTHYFDDEARTPAATAGLYKAPPVPAYAWTGFYAGLSVGAGGERTNASTAFSSTDINTQTVPPSGIFAESFDSGSASGDGRFRPGGLADLFLGYNHQFGTWVAGAQVEGTLARFNERLERLFSATAKNFTRAPLSLDQISTLSGQTNDTLTMNWMVSALGRVGYLVDSRNMIYGLGGWSFASFSTSLESDDSNRTFTANGPSVGAGWEQQLADSWSFRAEYRYTKFLDRTLSTQTGSAITSASLFGNGSSLFTSTNSSSTAISSDLHVFRLGFARAFSP